MSFRSRANGRGFRWIGGVAGAAALVVGCQGYLGHAPGKSESGSGEGDTVDLSAREEAENSELLSLAARRLSHRELQNTMNDLFRRDVEVDGNIIDIGTRDIVQDETPGGYDNNAKALQPSSLLLSNYEAIAWKMARYRTKDLEEWGGCNGNENAQACSKQLIAYFGERAFRRPLSDAEIQEFDDFFWGGTADAPWEERLRLTMQVIMLSPEFLYRIELGRPDDETKLTQYETASRLSYFIWGSMPDAELRAAAAAGELETEEQVAAQVDRMLADPRAKDAFAAFWEQWLYLSKIDVLRKSGNLEPDFVGRDHSRREAERFVSRILYDDEGRLEDLLTSREAIVNGPLADFYGVDGPSSEDEWSKVQLPPERSGGFLTQTGFLAIGGHDKQASPVLRGVFVLERLLCVEMGTPPPEAQNAQVPAGAEPQTNREEYELLTSGGGCDACHNIINPVGFAFENFNTVGHYRETENGITIDASGNVPGGDVVEGANALAQQLLSSPEVADCVAKHWVRYAQNGGVDPELAGAASDEILDGTLRDVFRKIATDPRFYQEKHL